MNILHHKSWHVRNKDNIQRVRRDEAKAAAEEKEKQKKIEIAESEARLNFLRAKSSTSDSSNAPSKPSEDELAQPEHINLFEENDARSLNKKNEEAEAEKKVEKEKFEKKIGLLKYLADDTLDLKSQPWYKSVSRNEKDDKEEIDLKRKIKDDPLETMKEFTDRKDSNKKHKKNKKKDKHKEKDEKSEISSPV